MNKRDMILNEAKRLFGQYGYLGFTLKELAKACSMTSPALYYFYSSKADLFRDCLLSEFQARRDVVERCANQAPTLTDFARIFAGEAIEVCEAHCFRTVRAMEEIVHLPDAMQAEMRAAWDEQVVGPLEHYLAERMPEGSPIASHRLIATFMIHLASFSAEHWSRFAHEELVNLYVAVCERLDSQSSSLPNR